MNSGSLKNQPGWDDVRVLNTSHRGLLRWFSSLFITPPETNIASENSVSQNQTSIPTNHFQVRLLLVSGRVVAPQENPYNKSHRAKAWLGSSRSFFPLFGCMNPSGSTFARKTPKIRKYLAMGNRRIGDGPRIFSKNMWNWGEGKSLNIFIVKSPPKKSLLEGHPKTWIHDELTVVISVVP